MNILTEIGIKDTKILTVFNKTDKIDIKNTPFPMGIKTDKIYISAKNDKNMNELLEAIERNLPEEYIDVVLQFPYDDTDILYNLVERFGAKPLYKDEGIEIEVSLDKDEYHKLKRYAIDV